MDENFIDFLINLCATTPIFKQCHANKYTLLLANHESAQILTSFYSIEMLMFIFVVTPNFEDRQVYAVSCEPDIILIFRSSINHGINIDLETFDFPFTCFGKLFHLFVFYLQQASFSCSNRFICLLVLTTVVNTTHFCPSFLTNTCLLA